MIHWLKRMADDMNDVGPRLVSVTPRGDQLEPNAIVDELHHEPCQIISIIDAGALSIIPFNGRPI